MSLSRASRASRRVKLWLHCHALEGCSLFLLCVPTKFQWKRPKRGTKRDSQSFDRDGLPHSLPQDRPKGLQLATLSGGQ
ncbi:hypothetical protein BD311DRAFT_753683, partial [Dichomitus squalens]